MPALLEQGPCELTWLVVRGEPVAAMYNVRRGGKVSFYQCGRKTGPAQRGPPRRRAALQAIRSAIEGGLREFDFLGGEATYKRQLATGSRPLVRLRIARPGLLELGRRLAGRVKDRLRPHWRRWRGRHVPGRPE